MKLNGLSSEKLNRIDREVPEKYGVSEEVLMENAGYQVADFLRRRFSRHKSFLFCIGKGNNGGDTLIAARRLHQWGYRTEIYMVTNDISGTVREKLDAAKSLGIDVVGCESFSEYDVLVDGLIGLNLKGDLREPYTEVIKRINLSSAEVVSVDIPTGVNPDTGKKQESCVKPSFTVTLGVPNQGLSEENAGEIWLGDVSYPCEIYRKNGIDPRIFEKGSLIKIEKIV